MVERLAIISDIHANLEALEAVLADIDARGASEILCLGDVVGYGVDAEACVDLVRERCPLCLRLGIGESLTCCLRRVQGVRQCHAARA